MAGKKRTDNKGRILRTGGMQRSEDSRYLYRYVDLSGKKKTIYALTLAELREKEKKIERDLQDGIDTSRGDMTLNQLFKIYMDTKTDLRESTRCNYTAAWNHAVAESVLGNMKIAQIKQLHIRSFYSELVKRGLSANTVKLYHNLIYPALELAVDSDIIRKNPAKDCRKGGRDKKAADSTDRSGAGNTFGFYGAYQTAAYFVFTNTQGKPYAVNAINFALSNIVKAYNKQEVSQAEKERREQELLPHVSAHILRHTACTRLAESGLEPKVLQYIMGHANISVTLDVYTHLDFTQIQKKMEDVQRNTKIG